METIRNLKNQAVWLRRENLLLIDPYRVHIMSLLQTVRRESGLVQVNDKYSICAVSNNMPVG
ncbi:hypothetical protein ACFP1I_08390 [Dyadobacter subterraneus]|uniref:Uncharacterized protein n=1 Tax=Dyadobacter subterraneus TaxID=2773304 RepID=A0ABR9WG02_9BACT|nr:hypothetical protein [Dyadobacter subterraneus]MBE9463846.1 hypothetical protein [Dyadobacter subterraneus]